MRFFKKRHEEASPTTARQELPTVKFDQSRVTLSAEKEIKTTLESIPEIDESNQQAVYAAAVLSVRRGRDLKTLYEALLVAGLSSKRASIVATFVNNRASSIMERERQLSLGITEAIWRYSGAPCMTTPKSPSQEEKIQDADHSALNGKRFSIAEGMLIRGRRVWPGGDIGCKCESRPCVSGFE